MQNWSQPGTGRDLSETVPDPPAGDEPTAQDEATAQNQTAQNQAAQNERAGQDDSSEWDELTSAGPGRITPPNDVLVAGGPLAQPAEEPAEQPAAAAVARPESPAAGPAPESPGSAGPAETAAHRGGSSVLESAAADQFQERWRDIQFGFVDDPQNSAQRAGDLAAEVLDAFIAALSTRKRSLDDERRTEPGEPADTERLRLAVRSYREFVDRLLNT